jgi:signal transduction histidine kinase
MFRVKRLPMVLDAEFSLRKGTERGRYELVISVVETRLWFFGLDVDLTAWSDEVSVNGLTTTRSTQGASPVIGRRFSAGTNGIVYLGLGGPDATIQLGYTHYNLFSRSVLFNVNVGYSDCATERADDARSDPGDGGCRTDIFDLGLDPTFASWSITGETPRLRINVDVPFRGNHGLRVLMSYRIADAGIRRQAFTPSRFDVFSDRDELRLNASWIYNSLDDPVFPSSGRLVQAGLDLSYLSADLAAFGIESSGAEPVGMKSRQGGALAIGSRFWPITESQSLSGRAEAFLGWSGVDNAPTDDGRILTGDLGVGRVSLAVGHAAFISRIHTDRKRRDVRWESEVEWYYSSTSPDFDTILLVVFVANVLLIGTVSVVRQSRIEPRLARLRGALSDLAAGRLDIEVGDRGRDTIGRIASMVEQTSNVMSRDRRRLAALDYLSAWQEAARRHAHEMRTPLTGARLELTRLDNLLAADGLARDSDPRRATTSVIEELDRLRSFADQFTSFARLPRPVLETHDIGDLLGDFVTTYADAWPNLTLELMIDGPVSADVDRSMLRQVLVNLCDNSAAAMADDDSSAMINDSSLAMGVERGTVVLTVVADGARAVIRVADDGPGIEEEVKLRLFEPYTTTRSIGDGMGLGLAISRKIMLDRGGDLELEDSSSEGAVFRVSLPIAEAV